jgi:glucose-6-phosphate isomerase
VKKQNILHKNYFKKKYLNKNFYSKFFNNIFNEIKKNCDVSQNTYHVLSKKFSFNFKLQDLKKFNKFEKIVLIGMGGSILGSKAIYSFLKKKIKKKVIFFDNLDKDKLNNFKRKNNKENCLFIVISKSGNTIETISNFIDLKILKNNAKNIIIISEKNENILYSIAKKYNLFFIEHKKYLGGRYSVLSEVGVVPSYFMGINIKNLRINLQKYFGNKEKSFLKQSSISLSQIIKKKFYKNLIFLNYSPKLEEFLFWCQQLMAESLGKKGKGMLPTISNSPKDHHSVLQLYLDGPKDKIFYLFSENVRKSNKIKTNIITKKLDYLNNKDLDEIKNAQKNAIKKVLIKNKIPFREFKINSFDEKTLGELFSYFILETSISGRLININPFNQPAVEQVKIFTKKLLS